MSRWSKRERLSDEDIDERWFQAAQSGVPVRLQTLTPKELRKEAREVVDVTKIERTVGRFSNDPNTYILGEKEIQVVEIEDTYQGLTGPIRKIRDLLTGGGREVETSLPNPEFLKQIDKMRRNGLL